MRSDPNLGMDDGLDYDEDLQERVSSRTVDEGASFSGHERNHLFLNRGGTDYVEVSAVSGLDHPGDSRAYARIDFDRDGWTDALVVNANAPFVQLYRNRIASSRLPVRNGSVALRFVGGNHAPAPAEGSSSRDGYGAVAELEVAGRTLVREHRAGEGRAAQNSATMLVGIGETEAASRVRVRWPSGTTHEMGEVPVGSLVTAYEDPAQSPTGEAFVVEPYRRDAFRSRPVPAESAPGAREPRLRVAAEAGPGGESDLVLYTTVATWCLPCLGELPSLEHIRESFTSDELAMYGIPYDPAEGEAELGPWAEQYGPPYRILTGLSNEDEELVKSAVIRELRIDGVPATIVTTGDGRIVLTRWGPPTVSELRAILDREARADD